MSSNYCLLVAVAFAVIATTYAEQVCYGKYGCFSHNAPFNRPLVPLPEHPKDIGLTFHVITRKDSSANRAINDHDVNLLRVSTYNGAKRTVIIVHGWMATVARKWQIEMGRAMIAKEDVNFIVANWKEGAREIYTTSVANTRVVGAQIAELIRFLNAQTRNTPASFHVIGFSLGAHVAAYVGQRFRKIKLARITGLDPASPLYKDEHIDVRLDPSDADFVDVIHTNSPLIGTPTKSGHLDFWPNGGQLQPGCSLTDGVSVVKCHHNRARDLYIDSISSRMPLRAYRCSNWNQFIRGNCMSCGPGKCPEMGHNAIKYKRFAAGNFYLHTRQDKPYAVNRYARVTIKTRNSWMADGHNPRIRFYGTNGDTGKIRLAQQDLHKGSIETFIAPINTNLGTLKSIDAWHSSPNPFSGWKLEKVTVKFMNSNERYTACFSRWAMLFQIPYNQKLNKGDHCY